MMWGANILGKPNLYKISKRKAGVITIILALAVLAIFALFMLLSGRDRPVLFQPYSSFTHANATRHYLLSKPKKLTQDTKIIVGLHGFGDSARKFAYYTGLHNAADANDIVVYPQAIKPPKGLKAGWNSGFCCGSGWKAGADDAGFIVSLVQYIKDTLGTKDTKIFVTGFSNGAFMAQRLAADFPDQFDGVAIASGSIGTEEKRLHPTQSIPILLMHGEKDQTVPFEGGFKETDPEFVWLPFSETRASWEQVNGSAAPVKVFLYPEESHKWHDWRLTNFWHKKPEASVEVVKFFNSL